MINTALPPPKIRIRETGGEAASGCASGEELSDEDGSAPKSRAVCVPRSKVAGRDRHSHSTLHGPLGAVCPPPTPHQPRTLLSLLFGLAAAAVEFAGDVLHFLSSL